MAERKLWENEIEGRKIYIKKKEEWEWREEGREGKLPKNAETDGKEVMGERRKDGRK